MTLGSGTRLGPYEILAAIGAGGIGEVYKARDTRLDRNVALKVLPAGVASDPERRRRFEQEARTGAALNHPHVCTLHDVGEPEGSTSRFESDSSKTATATCDVSAPEASPATAQLEVLP